MFLETVALVIGVLLCLYWYSARNYSYWKKKGIPYEEPAPIVGNLWDNIILRKSGGEISRYVYEKYPKEKVVGMYHFDDPVLLLRDPELVYKVYVTDFHSFEDNAYAVDEKVDPVFGKSVFFQKGDQWKKSRKMLSPAFTVGRIKTIFDQLTSVAEKLNEYIEKHPEEIELKHVMSRYAMEVSAVCVLGIEGHNFESEKPKMVDIGISIFEPSFIAGINQFIVLMMPTFSKLFSIKMVPKDVTRFFGEILGDIIERRQNQPKSRKDMVQHWLDLKTKSEEAARGIIQSDVVTEVLSNDDVLAGCITFFTESYETISMTASFALHYLALDKNLQDRVKQEIDDILGGCGGKLTYEAVTDMKLMNNVILEVLRIHPVVLHAIKSCTRNYEMDIGRAEPLVVEKGTSIIIPNVALSHDPKYWENPEMFNPDRFDEMNKDEWKKGIFLPFGDGPRMCIGMRLAYAIVKVALMFLLKEYEVVPTAKTPRKFVQDTRHFISRSRSGLWAKFVKREKSA